jgi:hypothetical protein
VHTDGTTEEFAAVHFCYYSLCVCSVHLFPLRGIIGDLRLLYLPSMFSYQIVDAPCFHACAPSVRLIYQYDLSNIFFTHRRICYALVAEKALLFDPSVCVSVCVGGELIVEGGWQVGANYCRHFFIDSFLLARKNLFISFEMIISYRRNPYLTQFFMSITERM